MNFTRPQLEQLCTVLHRAGELSHLALGITVPELLLITPDHTAEVVVLAGGIPDGAASAVLRRRAARIGAVAAAYTVEAWLGFVSTPLAGFERLAPDDLPRAADLLDRREAVTTTAVWPGGHTVVHCITVITRTAEGSELGPVRWMRARDYGTNQWLQSLITPP